MGVGNFFGTMPEEMRQNSHLHGVELDSISGRIARQLYQNADIQITGFEKTEFSDNFFDAAVGNVPFGSYGVSDKRYNRENFFIHDYFLAKTLDKLAPGGVAALITTKGTMDKENPKVREYLARRGDLIGAIRLPNNAFKANAGTEVTTDILFFQKREKMAVEMPDWCYVGKNNDGVPVNNYFIDHPEMVIGTMKQGVEFSMYGNSAETACVPIEGADLKAGQFTFKLSGGGVELTATNDANGQVTFSELSFTQIGTYTFTISEVNDGQQGVTYDETERKVTVTVEDDCLGNLIASVNQEELEACVFRNTYTKPEEPAKPSTPTPPTKFIPQTGDPIESAPIVVSAVLGVAILAVALVVSKRGKRT